MNYQKPISFDCHFEYRCTNSSCFYTHWLSLKEVQTKNFKVVCDCGSIFMPKRIKDISILYSKLNSDANKSEQPQKQSSPPTIPLDVLSKSSILLQQYGFTKQEAEIMILKAYENKPINSVVDLVKIALMSLEIKNV